MLCGGVRKVATRYTWVSREGGRRRESLERGREGVVVILWERKEDRHEPRVPTLRVCLCVGVYRAQQVCTCNPRLTNRQIPSTTLHAWRDTEHIQAS